MRAFLIVTRTCAAVVVTLLLARPAAAQNYPSPGSIADAIVAAFQPMLEDLQDAYMVQLQAPLQFAIDQADVMLDDLNHKLFVPSSAAVARMNETQQRFENWGAAGQVKRFGELFADRPAPGPDAGLVYSVNSSIPRYGGGSGWVGYTTPAFTAPVRRVAPGGVGWGNSAGGTSSSGGTTSPPPPPVPPACLDVLQDFDRLRDLKLVYTDFNTVWAFVGEHSSTTALRPVTLTFTVPANLTGRLTLSWHADFWCFSAAPRDQASARVVLDNTVVLHTAAPNTLAVATTGANASQRLIYQSAAGGVDIGVVAPGVHTIRFMSLSLGQYAQVWSASLEVLRVRVTGGTGCSSAASGAGGSSAVSAASGGGGFSASSSRSFRASSDSALSYAAAGSSTSSTGTTALLDFRPYNPATGTGTILGTLRAFLRGLLGALVWFSFLMWLWRLVTPKVTM